MSQFHRNPKTKNSGIERRISHKKAHISPNCTEIRCRNDSPAPEHGHRYAQRFIRFNIRHHLRTPTKLHSSTKLSPRTRTHELTGASKDVNHKKLHISPNCTDTSRRMNSPAPGHGHRSAKHPKKFREIGYPKFLQTSL